MGEHFENLPDKFVGWIFRQLIYFISVAPLDKNGFVYPLHKAVKGTLHIESKHQVRCENFSEDLTSLDAKTIQYVRENGRIILMFVALEGAPKIIRIWGKGTVQVSGKNVTLSVKVIKSASSCGYSIPIFNYVGERIMKRGETSVRHVYRYLPNWLADWIREQHMFFVSTSPLEPHQLINMSPKGVKRTFNIEDERQVRYEDLSGSGIETFAHVNDNSRITIMFISFGDVPRVLWIFGRGTAHELNDQKGKYSELVQEGTRHVGSRATIVVDIDHILTYCDYSLPVYRYEMERTALDDWAEKGEAVACEDLDIFESAISTTAPAKGSPPNPVVEYKSGSLNKYWFENNTMSLDGFTGLRTAHLFKIPAWSERTRPQK